MLDPAVGLKFHETLAGGFALGTTDPNAGARLGKAAGISLTLTSDITVDSVARFVDDPRHGAVLESSVDFLPLGVGLTCDPGRFELFRQSDDERVKLMIYRASFTAVDGRRFTLEGKKFIRDGGAIHTLLDATTTLYTRLYAGDGTAGKVVGAGVLHIGVVGAIGLVSSIRTTAGSWAEGEAAVAEFGSFFFGQLWHAYRVHLIGPDGAPAPSPSPSPGDVPRAPLARPAADLPDGLRANVVVIGSGYGGGIAAARLARVTDGVVVLERGKEWRPGDFPDTALEAAAETQIDTPTGRTGPRAGLYDFRTNETLDVMVGCGLGGTSLVNAGVALRPEPAVFAGPAWPAAIRTDPTALDDGFARAQAMLEPTPYPDDAPQLPKLVALERGAKALGRGFSRPPIAVAFADGPNAAGIAQRTCTLCGDCASGCNNSAKRTVDMTYLADAHAHGAALYTEVTVRWIERVGDRYKVVWRWTDAEDDDQLYAIEAPVVILAAGALGSTEILLRSRNHGLPVSARLGHQVSANGDYLSFSYNGDDRVRGVGMGERPVDPRDPVGPTIAGMIHADPERELPLRYVVEEGAIPGALADALPVAFAVGAGAIGVNTATGLIARIRQATRSAASLLRGAYHGAVDHTLTTFAIGHDDAGGAMVLATDDRLRIVWPRINDQPVYQDMQRASLTVTRDVHGINVKEPTWTDVFHRAALTAHPLGGCAMADDAAHGVVNDRGEVFAGHAGAAVHAGLYVADGAIVPSSLGVNPLLTISALAERIMALMIAAAPWARG